MGITVSYFDIWQPGYAGASVAIFAAGTNTLLPVFTDQALTVPTANPQTLMRMSQNGQNFGKFANPVYVGADYTLNINGTDVTGIVAPPLDTLAGQDASAALVTATGSATPHHLYDIVARTIDVLDSGEFLSTSNPGASSATNNSTLVDAIGKAAALGGGIVRVPAGTFAFTSLSIPANVIVTGQGRDVTTLQSQLAGKVVTYAGDAAGLAEITIDGVNLGIGSIGVFSKAKNETRFKNVCLKRFATCLSVQGGRRADWKDLYIDNGTNGAVLKGDAAASSGNDGDEFRFNEWKGGRVTNCTGIGVWIGYVDKKCWHNCINDVGFENNTGIAFKDTGARWTDMEGCWWSGNITDMAVEDGSDTTKVAENSVVGLHVSDFLISSDMTFTGKCQDVIFERGEFSGGTYTLTSVLNTIVTKDSTESSTVGLAGGSAKQWMRTRTELGDSPNSSGITTDDASTEIWSFALAPGEVVFLEAKIIANGRNCNDHATYHISQGATRPGSTLNYDGQTANFTLGSIITGATSGATARIIADTDAGATGTLVLRDIVGELVDNEDITDTVTGKAVVNGVLSHQNAALLGGITSISPATETDASWDVVYAVTAGSVRLMFTGAAAKTIEITAAVQVTSG